MSEKIAKLRKDMKRLPELCGFAEQATTVKSMVLIKAKMLGELEEIERQVIHLFDKT